MTQRERYEDWLDHEHGIPKRGSSQQRQPHMRAAQAKRERKAARAKAPRIPKDVCTLCGKRYDRGCMCGTCESTPTICTPTERSDDL